MGDFAKSSKAHVVCMVEQHLFLVSLDLSFHGGDIIISRVEMSKVHLSRESIKSWNPPKMTEDNNSHLQIRNSIQLKKERERKELLLKISKKYFFLF